MSLQRGHKKDIGMIGRINEKELWALSLNCMERKDFEAYSPPPTPYYILIFKEHSTLYSYSQISLFGFGLCPPSGRHLKEPGKQEGSSGEAWGTLIYRH